MAGLDQESLFSLELVVDQLHLSPSTECRLPAIAFRLLDFPTLLIHHVEPELADTIRSRLVGSRHNPVPAQLRELKDRKTGAFVIRRGKSCLFRVSPNAIVANLSSAPLYVMVMDMFSATPKLIGNCAIPLDSCVNDLYSDIALHGLSVPAVRGEKQELDVRNLMGKKLGTVALGFRLLSLGAALLSHLPAHNVIHVKPKEDVEKPAENFVVADTHHEVLQGENDMFSDEVQNFTRAQTEQPVDVEMQLPMKSFTDSHTQFEPRNFSSVRTQTTRPTARHSKAKQFQLVDNISGDDIPTSNIIRPPPLYYNSVTCKKTVYWQQHEDWSSVWYKSDDDCSWSESGTIRIEDKYLDSDEKMTDRKQALSTANATDDDRQPGTRAKSPVRKDPVMTAGKNPGSMAGFPILNALMAEILRFQGLNLTVVDASKDADQELRYKIRPSPKAVRARTQKTTQPVQPKVTVHRCENMLPAHEKGGVRVQRRRPSSAAATEQAPLMPGLTNTQRLRLARVNPKLLQELEDKETQRKQDFRAARLRSGKLAASMRQKENIAQGDQHDGIQASASPFAIDLVANGEYTMESQEGTAHYKRPVPTPRTSVLLLKERQLNGESAPNAAGFGTNTYTVGRERTEPPLSLRSSSEEKIKFTVPIDDDEDDQTDHNLHHAQHQQTVVRNYSDSRLLDKRGPAALNKKPTESAQTTGRESDKASRTGFGQTRSVSVPMKLKDLPNSSVKQKEDSTSAGGDGILSIEDLGLRKIVDHFSGDTDDNDDGDDENGSKTGSDDAAQLTDGHLSHDSARQDRTEGSVDGEGDGETAVEPELRKVVDFYSDYSDDEHHNAESAAVPRVPSLKTLSTVDSYASSFIDSSRLQSSRQPTAGRASNVPPLVTGGSPPSTAGRKGDATAAAVPLTERSMSLGAEYSDAFETITDDDDAAADDDDDDDDVSEIELQARPVTAARPLPSAQLGYTWT